MELIIILLLVLVVLRQFQIRKNSKPQEEPPAKYQYKAKEHLMTRTEEEFFRLLTAAVSEKYHVFPQIHLSAILDHRVLGQDYKWAFRHIHQKSVDYVLCDRQTLKPTYAIELDDYTHSYSQRIERDKEVEKIFRQAGVLLVRFTDKSVTKEAIIRRLSEVHRTKGGPSATDTPTPDKTPA